MPLQQAGQPISAATINRQYTLADANNSTVSGTAYANLCTAYTIPGSDAAQFTAYRLSCWGTAAWGGTPQKLQLAMVLAGTAIGTQQLIASTAFSASATINWRLALTLMCVSTGASGTWSAELSGIFSQTANNLLPGTAADNTVPVAAVTATDVTQDTTAANSVVIQAKWVTTTGPSITATNTMFERLAV